MTAPPRPVVAPGPPLPAAFPVAPAPAAPDGAPGAPAAAPTPPAPSSPTSRCFPAHPSSPTVDRKIRHPLRIPPPSKLVVVLQPSTGPLGVGSVGKPIHVAAQIVGGPGGVPLGAPAGGAPVKRAFLQRGRPDARQDGGEVGIGASTIGARAQLAANQLELRRAAVRVERQRLQGPERLVRSTEQ